MKKNIIKITIYSLIVLFITLLLAESFGYYETRDKKVKTLTEEQIKKFENDIKDGKSIDVESYVNYQKKDYSNNLSNGIYKISLSLEKTIDKGVKIIFNKIGDTVNN